VREVDVRRVVRRHPQVGVDLLDRQRGVVHQPEEQADLHEHQRHREGDAGDGDHEAQLVVQQRFGGEINGHE
jgi:hypothetical protein